MAVTLPKNTHVALATTYATAIAFSAITNANPAVATSTGHGLLDDAIVAVTSGWSKLNDRVVKLVGVATNDFDFAGINTTSTANYPAGAGAGTVAPITAWTSITQVLDLQSSGGEQGFANYGFLEDDMDLQIPDRISPMQLALQIADDAALPGYQALKAAHEASAVRAMRLTLPSGSIIYCNGYVSFNEVPIMTKGQVMAVRAQLSLVSRPVRYAPA